MGEENRVGFYYGIQSNYDRATINESMLYFITDKHRIYKGSTLIVETNVEFTTVAPTTTNTTPGMLYVYTDATNGKTSTLINTGTEIVTVSGGEATEVADGILTVSNFNADSISQSIPTNPDTASDTKLVTEKAASTLVDTIKTELQNQIDTLDGNFDTVKDAFVNVSVGESTTEGKFNLNFYKASSPTANPISIELDKEQYLLDASLSEDGQNLVLTIQVVNTEGEPTTKNIEVPLAQLVATAKTVKTVDSAIDVQLGDGATLGGYKTGDTIAVGTPIQTVIAKLLAKQVPPTYVQPTIAITNNSGTAAGNYEIGTTITPNISASFKQNDAGALTGIQFKKNSTNVGEVSATSPAVYDEASVVLANQISFSAVASYAEGAIKNDNLGEPYPTGHIAAGSKTSSSYTYTPYRQGYFIGSTTDTATLTSATVRGLSKKKNGAYSSGNINFTIPVGAARIVIACPANKTGVTKIQNTTITQDVTPLFTKSTLSVEGANGYAGENYNIWVYAPDTGAYTKSQDLVITLG